MPVAADAPRGKHEVVLEEESSTASVESRFVPLASPPPPAKLDSSLGMLIASSGFSVGAGGADSDNSEDRSSSKSSTAASAPRRHDLSPFAARDHAADRARSSLHGKNPRAARARADKARAFAAAEAENSRSSVESDLRSSNAVNSRQSGAGIAGNGIHNYKENGSLVGRLAPGSVDSDADAAERSVGKNGDSGSRIQSSDDPYEESILLLQRTQEALENEIQKFVVIRKESSDDFDGCDDDWSGLVHLEEPLEETSQNVKDVESRLEEASYLGQLFLEKTEAEIQSTILTRAAQTWAPLTEDQIALYNAQKSLSGDYKQLELKLQHTKNRAVMLEEMAEKLKAECKDISGSSEVLRLQSRASRVSLFCFIQFVLLFTAIGTFLARLLPSPTEDVPT
ncbi:hypothetical protein E2562_018167 [Oryza meyeriana var. granulata]|uniref:Uncharacterized protein n=1 Tax=Oryza meyeriana var. granulata TaxID=110450 RepID=A0A6G1C6F5_9ORYZ|nr:hypothetical protein E2562_018167 [Oryza meyeriana var. granulata]